MTYTLRLLSACLLVTAACATGTLGDDEPFPSGSGGGFGGDGGSFGSAEGGGGFGEGGMGGGFGEGGMGGSPVTCGYDSPNVCMTAEGIPKIAGDENGPTVVKTGNTSMWFEIEISEEVSSISEARMSYTVTLDSPPGMQWNLVVREGPEKAGPDCNATNKPVTAVGNSEVVANDWKDNQGLGGKDDSRWISIGVIYNTGDLCDEAASWTLSIEGDTY